MAFNIDNDKVIGIIDRKLGGESAKIRAIAILKKDSTTINLTDHESEELFPPWGFVFEPGFFYNFKYQENEFISFFIDENERAENGQDKYRLKVGASEAKNYGFNARRITGFNRNNLSTDLSLIKVEGDISDGKKFFGVTDKYIVGELKMKNGIIEPALHRRIKFWDFEEGNVLSYNSHIKLHHCPIGDSIVLDCRNDKQLFDWFRDELKKVEPDYVNLLDKKAKWRTEIPKLFSEADNDRYEVDKIRFERINEKFRLINLEAIDIKNLIEKSDSLKDIFTDALEIHKEEFKLHYKNQIEEYRKDYDNQKTILDKELDAIKIDQKKKEVIVDSLRNEIEDSESEIERLNQNKERILNDFSIIKDVLSTNSNTNTQVSTQSESFVLESTDNQRNKNLFSSKKDFILELKFQLNTCQLSAKFAKRLLDAVSIYKGIFLKDIKLGIALVEATHNTKYIIQQVEPDWLHFSDLWNNGLGAIWKSAHTHPDILHFLFLQDVNLSSPECYARPLFDMINGIRKRIPFGKTFYPENLKILATKASTTEPEIGLPLIEQTFDGWGAVGFNDNLYEQDHSEFKSLSGFINSETFYSYQLDEFDIDDIKSSVVRELTNLFETE